MIFKLVQINFITPFYIQLWLNLSLNPQKLHHVRTYIYVYTLFFKKFLGPKSRVHQPSKRLQEIDPLAPLTPAPPKTKQRKKPVSKTPIPPFATHQIHGSQNQRAAAMLFTPHRQHMRAGPTSIPQQPPSPTPQRTPTSSILLSPTGSDVEEDIRAGLEKLDLQPRSSLGSQSPWAGPHSKQIRAKTKPGAPDVWSFIEKTAQHRTCILCK